MKHAGRMGREFTQPASFWHRRIEVLIFAIIVLHLAAIATYRFLLGQNLIPAMIHGGRDRNNAPVSWRFQVGRVAACRFCAAGRYWDATATVSVDQSYGTEWRLGCRSDA